MTSLSFSKKWIIAARPKTLIASICPVCFGNLMALHQSSFSFLVFLLSLLFALSVQIGTNLVNDYFDYKKGVDTEDRVGPLRVMQAKLVTSYQMKRAISFVFLLSSFIGISLMTIGGFWILILAFFAILLGFLYTAGPFPLSYIGLADLVVLIFFGPVATLGCYYLQTHTLSAQPMIAGFCAGFFSCAILTANNLRDEQQDRNANKKTPIVRFGRSFGQIEYILCLLMPFLLLFTLNLSLPFLSLIFCIKPMKKVIQNKAIHLVLKETVFVMLCYTILFCFSSFIYN